METTPSDVLSEYYVGKRGRVSGDRKFRVIARVVLDALQGGILHVYFDDGQHRAVKWRGRIHIQALDDGGLLPPSQ